MNPEELKEKLRILTVRHERDTQAVRTEYALSNNPYKVGDVFTDHIGSIKIDKIAVTIPWNSNVPCCSYTGVELKKDGTLTKKTVNPYCLSMQ